MLTITDHVSIPREVLCQEVGEEAVLLDLSTETYFGLDEIGARVWQLIREHGSLYTILEIMLAEYDVERARLEDDLIKYIGDLAGSGLVSVDSPSSSGLGG